MIARTSNIRKIRSYNGSNFICTDIKLKKTFQGMDHVKIKQFPQDKWDDWLVWIKNTPAASHMSELLERKIQSARNIPSSQHKNHRTSLNDEALCTLMSEVEAIFDSGPWQ